MRFAALALCLLVVSQVNAQSTQFPESHRSIEVYQQYPRRTYIGAQPQEARFSRYAERWVAKIEAEAAKNYPKEFHGFVNKLLVSASIRSDGSLESVEVNRSSGSPAVDRA